MSLVPIDKLMTLCYYNEVVQGGQKTSTDTLNREACNVWHAHVTSHTCYRKKVYYSVFRELVDHAYFKTTNYCLGE